MTLTDLRDLLDRRFGGVLVEGFHQEDGQACVRELRAAALSLPWSDHPDGGTASLTDIACQYLNDSPWSSDAARTAGCLPLAMLSEHTAPAGWVSRYTELTIRRVVPFALRAAAECHPTPARAEGLLVMAMRCEVMGTVDAALDARDAASAASYVAVVAGHACDAANAAGYAANAAGYAANAAGYAARDVRHASDAARAACDAASYAASAASYAVVSDVDRDAARDEVLTVAVACLLEAHGRADLIPAENRERLEECR